MIQRSRGGKKEKGGNAMEDQGGGKKEKGGG